MSTNSLSRDFRRDLERIAAEASATITYECSGGGHTKIWLTRNGERRFVITSSTSVNRFREQNILGDVRRELRKLGYEKPNAEWGMQRPTLKRRRSLSRPLASPRERLDHRKRPRTDPDVYLNAMGATLAQFKTTAKRSGAR